MIVLIVLMLISWKNAPQPLMTIQPAGERIALYYVLPFVLVASAFAFHHVDRRTKPKWPSVVLTLMAMPVVSLLIWIMFTDLNYRWADYSQTSTREAHVTKNITLVGNDKHRQYHIRLEFTDNGEAVEFYSTTIKPVDYDSVPKDGRCRVTLVKGFFGGDFIDRIVPVKTIETNSPK